MEKENNILDPKDVNKIVERAFNSKEPEVEIEKDIEKLKNEMLEAIKNNKIVDIG